MTEQPIIQKIADRLKLRPAQVRATVELLDADNTLPFIARYRKEVTGSLDEEQLRALTALLDQLRTLEDRRQSILSAITEQGKLTPQLSQQIASAETLAELEDLYALTNRVGAPAQMPPAKKGYSHWQTSSPGKRGQARPPKGSPPSTSTMPCLPPKMHSPVREILSRK
jgi:hypothetical protein